MKECLKIPLRPNGFLDTADPRSGRGSRPTYLAMED